MNRKLIALAGAGLVLAAGGTTAAVAVTADNPVRAIPVNVTFKTPNGAHPVRLNLYGLPLSLRCWAPARGRVSSQVNILARTGWSGYGDIGMLPHRVTWFGPITGFYPSSSNAAYINLNLVGPKGNSYTLSLGYGGTPGGVTACRFVGSMTSLGH